ncbi:hypothetical protein ACFV4F_40350 [Kitasatospora sp. NPDC059722]|uniref:hypothetical protein n=1 Tax=Kitasatospora sp. NPDC059722 TaxID=3346925 RepID=UPI0036AAE7F8
MFPSLLRRASRPAPAPAPAPATPLHRVLVSALALLGMTAGLTVGVGAMPATAATGIDLCAEVGYTAGFRGDALVTAIAVGMAESSCNPLASNVQNNTPPSTDRGLWEINSYWHPEVSDACAYDAQCNANAAYRISNKGTDWAQWSTYKEGAHLRYLDAARAAADRLGHHDPGPAPVVYPTQPGRVVSARSADGRLEVFAAGANGVSHAWQNKVNGDWSEWESLDGPGGARLTIGADADGRLELFALNGSTLQHRYQLQPSGAWSGWDTFGAGGHDLTVDHNQDGRLEVFASGSTGVYHRYQTNPTTWSGWEPTGGPADSQLTSEHAPDGRVEVFAINGTTAQHLWQTGVNAPYDKWVAFGGPGTEITAAANADGRIEVFGSSGAGVHHRWQTGFSTWSEWSWLNTTSGPAVG